MSNFVSKVENVSQALKNPDLLVTEDLEIVSKKDWFSASSWYWWTVSLFQPIASCLDIDLLAHVRIHNVACNIFAQYKEEKQNLTFDSGQSLLSKIKDIIKPLSQQSGLTAKINPLLDAINHLYLKTEHLEEIKSFNHSHLCKPLKWPDLSNILVGEDQRPLTPKEANQIEQVYHRYLKQIKLSDEPLLINCFEEEDVTILGLYKEVEDGKVEVIEEHEVPCYVTQQPILLQKDVWSQTPHLFLISDELINLKDNDSTKISPSRFVSYCYDLTDGKTYISKEVDKRELEFIKQLKGVEGAEQVVSYEKINRNKFEAIVEKYDLTLDQAIENNRLNLSDKISIMQKLLEAMQNIHKNTTTLQGEEMPFTYLDISKSNILLRKNNEGGWETAIIDYESIGFDPDKRCNQKYIPPFTKKYCSPLKYITVNNFSDLPDREYIEFLSLYGKQSDLWSLAVVFIELLGIDVPNFYEFYKQPYLLSIQHEDNDLKFSIYFEKVQNVIATLLNNLKQKDLIGKYTNNKAEERRIFTKVIQPMLQADPEKRITAEEALQRLNALLTKRNQNKPKKINLDQDKSEFKNQVIHFTQETPEGTVHNLFGKSQSQKVMEAKTFRFDSKYLKPE